MRCSCAGELLTQRSTERISMDTPDRHSASFASGEGRRDGSFSAEGYSDWVIDPADLVRLPGPGMLCLAVQASLLH